MLKTAKMGHEFKPTASEIAQISNRIDLVHRGDKWLVVQLVHHHYVVLGEYDCNTKAIEAMDKASGSRDSRASPIQGHGHSLPYFAQCAPKISSGTTRRGTTERDTQVRLQKCRTLTFSVVIFPPQDPQDSESV
jgi:hypothetical protein